MSAIPFHEYRKLCVYQCYNWLWLLYRPPNWLCLKKLVKLVAVVVGLFFAGIAYLQHEEVVNVNWTKLQAASQNTVSTIVNATTQIPGFGSDHHTATLVMTNLGIPLTGSLSMGIATGFMKG